MRENENGGCGDVGVVVGRWVCEKGVGVRRYVGMWVWVGVGRYVWGGGCGCGEVGVGVGR